MFAVAAIVVLSILAGCTDAEKEATVTNFGEEKAYAKNNGVVLTLANGTAAYYVGGISGKYLSAATYAIGKLNATSSKLNITSTGTSSSNFKFSVGTWHFDANAMNFNSPILNNQIVSSEIMFYDDTVKGYSDNSLRHVALHELGHTIGLIDQNHPQGQHLKDHSVMWYQHIPGQFTAFQDYQEFDIHNIHWKYGK